MPPWPTGCPNYRTRDNHGHRARHPPHTPGAGPQQRRVIAHAKGPLLVAAGPGSGKTHCVALRAVNLLLTGQCPPGGLVLCTFGRNAALELRQRFTVAAQAFGVLGNFSLVSVSTIHSLCHRILTSHPGTAGLRLGYGLLNESKQQMLMHREFDRIFGADRDVLSGRGWRSREHTVAEAAKYFDRICDELIDPLDLERSVRAHVGAMGRCLQRYRNLLLDLNLVDFAHLQVWAEQLLRRNEAFTPASPRASLQASTGPDSTTWPSPGHAICWCSPRLATCNTGFAPYGKRPQVGLMRTGSPCRSSGSA